MADTQARRPLSLDEIHSKSVRLCGVLTAIDHLQNEDACKAGQASLIEVAMDLARELENSLDSVNAPELPACA